MTLTGWIVLIVFLFLLWIIWKLPKKERYREVLIKEHVRRYKIK